MRKTDFGNRRGFALIELLVVIGIFGFFLSAVVGIFSAHNQSSLREEQRVALQQNLRIGLSLLKDHARSAGFGVPSAAVDTWVPWVRGFASNPTVVDGGGSHPDTLSVARCTSRHVATLSADAPMGSTTLRLVPSRSSTLAAELDTGSKRLIRVGGERLAWVRSMSGSSVTIDTDPTTGTIDPLTLRGFVAGTPVCRVDVFTFDLGTDPKTGRSQLRLDANQGAGPEGLIDGITDLQITQQGAGELRIRLTATTEQNVPGVGTRSSRTLVSDVTLRNP